MLSTPYETESLKREIEEKKKHAEHEKLKNELYEINLKANHELTEFQGGLKEVDTSQILKIKTKKVIWLT